MTIKDHYYMPDYQAMGDCRACGHEQNKPWHIGEVSSVKDRIKRVDESLAKQLERSIRLNCEFKKEIDRLQMELDKCRNESRYQLQKKSPKNTI